MSRPPRTLTRRPHRRHGHAGRGEEEEKVGAAEEREALRGLPMGHLGCPAPDVAVAEEAARDPRAIWNISAAAAGARPSAPGVHLRVGPPPGRPRPRRARPRTASRSKRGRSPSARRAGLGGRRGWGRHCAADPRPRARRGASRYLPAWGAGVLRGRSIRVSRRGGEWPLPLRPLLSLRSRQSGPTVERRDGRRTE